MHEVICEQCGAEQTVRSMGIESPKCRDCGSTNLTQVTPV